MPSKSFKLNEKFYLPSDVCISGIENKFLVIAPKKGTYIVLDNIQLKIFNYLKTGHTLKELLNSNFYNIDLFPKLQDLLVQFEVRNFYESYHPDNKTQLTARLFLTNACNLRCIHCYRYSGDKEKNELRFYEWKEILQKLKVNGIKDISISGGEPFVYNYIYELIDYAVENVGMNVKVLSNGTKIDFEYTSTLKKLKEIQLSIDGPSEKINDEIRGNGVYLKVMNTLDKLYSIGITVTISMALFDKNFEDYKLSLEPFLQKLKNRYGNLIKIRFTSEILPGRNINKDEICLSNNSLQNFVDVICKKVYGPEWIFQTYYNLISNFHTNCGYGTVVTIDSIGTIYSCNLPYYPIGDIYKDSFPSIIVKLRELNKNFVVDNIEPCSKCDLRYICGGKCRVLNNYLYGNMKTTKCDEEYIQRTKRILVESYYFLYSVLTEKNK